MTTNSQARRALGAQSPSTAADVLARHLGISVDEAQSRLERIAESVGVSGTELAELIRYRDTATG